jgi:signal transduction histidine kinase
MKILESLKQSLRKYYVFALLIMMLCILFGISATYFFQIKHHSDYQNPKAVQGVFDYSNIDFNLQKYTSLEGEVEFYWEQLLTPKDFKHDSESLKPYFQTIPKAWNDLVVNGKKVGRNGYGTYRFKILVPSPGLYSLKIKEFESAFHIWINSKDYGGAGKVGTRKKDMVPSWQRQEYNFQVDGDSVEVILQISNFQHRLGGASEIMLFGSEHSIKKVKSLRVTIEAFLIGMLAILLIYHLTIYHYRRVDKSVYYFSLTSLFFLLRMSTTGEKLLLDFFSFLPWAVTIRIEYISIPMIGFALVNFIYQLLPENIPVWFKRSINMITLVLSAVIIFTPASVFTYVALLTPILTGYLIIGMFIFLLKAVIQKKKNALGLFWSLTFMYVAMINDVLVYFNVIDSSYLLPFGLITLILTQAFIISRNFSLAYLQVEELSKELEKHAEELEEIVSQRTRKLEERNSEIEIQKNKIETQAEILNQTNQKLLELDKFKKEMTNMMVHDLKNPLANIIGFMQLPEITEKTRGLVQASGQDMQNMIQNILDVTKYEQTELKIHPDKHALYELADTAFKQNEYNIKLRSIHVENTISKDLVLNVDKKLLIRVFSNIISNATKYLSDNGVIRVSSELEGNSCKVSIYNSGEPIPENKLQDIFDIYAQASSHSYSTGIGLAFCKMAVKAHGGEIGVISKENEGVTFWFSLPVTSN